MPLGPHIPEWRALKTELERLETLCSASVVAVVSTGNVLWCASRTDADVDDLADALYRAHIAPRRQALARGERLDYVQRGTQMFGTSSRLRVLLPYTIFARSFANIYVLVVWIGGPYDESTVRAEMQRSLPRVEALTVSLPPPSPEPAEGVGKQRA